MKAISVSEFGDTGVLRLQDVPDLKPVANEILVDIKAIGVNPVDTYIRAGTYPVRPTLPYTPGMDAAGLVAAVGEEIKEFNAGDHVYVAGSITGTYAQQAICSPSQVHPLPDNISFKQGAAIGVPYVAAYRALFTKAKSVSKETVLVHGASGGVGTASVQLARTLGMKILATAGTEKGRQLVLEQGADFAIDHHAENYLDEIMKITEGQGVNVILEMLSNVNLGNDLKMIAKKGRIVVIGCRGEVTINPRDAMSKDATILGMTVMNATKEEKAKIHEALGIGFEKGKLYPVIGKEFSLKEAGLAHKAILEPGAHGKIILIP
ncbi:MAG: NADPH:quinone reductase [Candidatus Omnitrophota bacterium]